MKLKCRRPECQTIIDPKPPGCVVPRWYCGWECEEKAAKAGAYVPSADRLRRTLEREAARSTDDGVWRDE